MQNPKSIRKRKRKIRKGSLPGLPYPNYHIKSDEPPTICTCEFDGENFYVSSPSDIQTLYENGCFGKSTITQRNPLSEDNMSFDKQPYFQKVVKDLRPVITPFEFPVTRVNTITSSEHTMESEVAQNLQTDNLVTSSCDTEDNPVELEASCLQKPKDHQSTTSGTTELQSCDSSANPDPREDPIKEVLDVLSDKLELFPEEVMFLTFGIGCLLVQTKTGRQLNHQDLWTMFCYKNHEFPISYAVYHYYRCKNWIPKDGRSYGGNFVLYEQGPEHFHSLYIVHIFKQLSSDEQRPRWIELCARQRLASHAAKIALICEVQVPNDILLEDPISIFHLEIHETPLYRWAPNFNK